MKKSVIILISMLLLLITSKAMASNLAPKNDELVDLTEIVEESNLTVDQWQVIIKEQIDDERITYIIDELKNSYLVSTSEDENVIKYSISDVHKTSSIFESYKVIVPKNQAYKAEVIAVIHGEIWDDSIEENYGKTLDSILEKFFTKQAKKFACLTTVSNDTISSDYFLEKITQNLNLQHISTQYDTVKKSTHEKIIYGYTPLWNQKITVMDKPRNIQMAVRALENGSTKYTIGTPILITEY